MIKAFAKRQLAFLSTLEFTTFGSGVRRESDLRYSLGFSIFQFFFRLAFLSFSFGFALFSAVISDLLLALLAVKKTYKNTMSSHV